MFGNVKRPAKPVVIRKVSTTIKPTEQSATNGNAQRRPNPASSSGASKQSLQKQRDGVRKAKGLLTANAKRHDSRTASPSPSLSDARRVSSIHKRKAPSPALVPDFGSSSDEEEDEDQAAGAGARKKMRPSPRNGTLEPDMKRSILDKDALVWSEDLEKQYPIIHGYDLTLGKAKEYPSYMASSKESLNEIGLADFRYPSNCEKERFQLVIPNDKSDYDPIEDIIQNVAHICEYYFPEKQASYLIDEITGYPRRFRKANRELNGPLLAQEIEDFNNFIKKSVEDGTIPSFLRTQHSVPLPLVERILSQIYTRTVSPQVNILKQYENGTDDVYGELLPRFVHKIFLDTHLRSDQVFVDLGSGVGNVVLQAALEIGCESWGVERMPNPAGLAAKQKEEFIPRCKRWALKTGTVNVIQGDFLLSPEIDDVLRRADVILVNNQAFTPKLNGELTMKFLDLKEGCKIVSLRSFVPDNWQLRDRNSDDPRNLLNPVVKMEYFSGSVSWTDVGGYYFVATKDSRKLRRWKERQEKMAARTGQGEN